MVGLGRRGKAAEDAIEQAIEGLGYETRTISNMEDYVLHSLALDDRNTFRGQQLLSHSRKEAWERMTRVRSTGLEWVLRKTRSKIPGILSLVVTTYLAWQILDQSEDCEPESEYFVESPVSDAIQERLRSE